MEENTLANFVPNLTKETFFHKIFRINKGEMSVYVPSLRSVL